MDHQAHPLSGTSCVPGDVWALGVQSSSQCPGLLIQTGEVATCARMSTPGLPEAEREQEPS